MISCKQGPPGNDGHAFTDGSDEHSVCRWCDLPKVRQAVCSLVVNREGLVLTVWNRKFMGWCLPGGKVEPGETIEQANTRELREETGLVAKQSRHVYSAPGCVEPDVLVDVFEVDTDDDHAVEMEEGCPVSWQNPRSLAISKPFGPFYKAMFDERYPRYFHVVPVKKKGLKHDGADGRSERKLRWSLLPFDAVREVVRVLTKGAEKYSPGGWALVDNAKERYTDALLRHIAAYAEGERADPEWGFHTLSHACCCALFLIALDLRESEPEA